MKIVFTISPGFPGHRCISLLALLGISCFFKLAWLRIAGHRLELPALLGYRFFLQDYIVFHSCLTISPCIAGHRWHRCLCCQGHLSWHPCASLGIASLRISPGIAGHLSFLHSFVWLGIAGHRRELLAVPGHRFFYRIILCFILVSLSLLASPGIAGIAAYLSWHRWASFVVSLGIDWVSLDIAEYRRAWPGIAGHLRIVQGLAIYNCLY